MKRDNDTQPQNVLSSETLNNRDHFIRKPDTKAEKTIFRDVRKMIPRLPKVESIGTLKEKNSKNSPKIPNSDRANSASARSDASSQRGIIEKFEFVIDENKNIISSPRRNTEKTKIKKVKYNSVERDGKTYNIAVSPSTIKIRNQIDKKNYLKKLSTIVRIEDHLEMKKLNYTKEYFSVIKNNLLGNFQIKKEGKLINKTVETLEEINNPFKYQKQSPRNLGRKLTIIRDNSHSILLGRHDYLNNQNSNIFLTMAFMSGKGIYREDKLFERGKRVEKGGVVDFLYKTKKIPQKHQIKGTSSKFLNKVSAVNLNRKISAKEKDKAAKRIQNWWRRILISYKDFTSKLIKIQSNWRGHWIRSNQYDILYYSLITYSFVEKLNKVILNYNYRTGLDSLIDKFGDKYKKKMYVLKFVKIQREVKKFLKKKREKIVNKHNFSEYLKSIFNRKTFKFLKVYSEHRQSILFKNINFLLRIKKLMRKDVFNFIKNPGKIRKKINSPYVFTEFENRTKKEKLKKLNKFFSKWFDKVVLLKKRDNFIKEISCIVKYREPSKKQMDLKDKLFNKFVKSRTKEIDKTLITKWFRFWFNSSIMISDHDEDEFMTDSILLNTNFGEIIYPKKYLRKSTNCNISNDSMTGEGKGLPTLRFFKQISFKFKTPLKKWSTFLEEIFRILENITTQITLDPFEMIKATVSKDFLKRIVENRIIPFCLNVQRKDVKYSVNLWKNRIKEREIEKLKSTSLKFLYNRLKNKFNFSVLRERLKLWQSKKRKIIRSNKIASSVGFLEIVDDEAKKKETVQKSENPTENPMTSNKVLKSKRTFSSNINNEIDSDCSDENEYPRKFIKSSYFKKVLEKNLGDFCRSSSIPCYKLFFRRLKILDRIRISLNVFLRKNISSNENEYKKMYLRKWQKNQKLLGKRREILKGIVMAKYNKQLEKGFKRVKAIINNSLQERKRNKFLKISSGFNKLSKLYLNKFYKKLRTKHSKSLKAKNILIDLISDKRKKSIKNYFNNWRGIHISSITNNIKALQIKCLSKKFNLKLLSKAYQKFNQLRLKKFTVLPNLINGLDNIKNVLKKSSYSIIKDKLEDILSYTLPKPKLNQINSKFLVFNRVISKPFFDKLSIMRDWILFKKKLKERISKLESLNSYSIPRYLQKWKSAIPLIKENDDKKKIKSIMLKNMYRSFHKSRSLLNYFRYWKKMLYPNLASKLFIVAQKISKFSLLSNYKKNLKNSFRKWVSRIFKFGSKEGFYLKYRLLKRLICHKTDKLKEMNRLLVFIRLLKWKLIHNSMIDEKSHNIRFGFVMLRQIVKKKHIKFFKGKLKKKFDTSRRNVLLYQAVEKFNKKFFNLQKFILKWKQFSTFSNEIDASFLKCKSLEINFDRPTSNILEKLKGKYLRGTDTLMQRNPNKYDVIQAKINFEAGKKYLKIFFLVLKSQNRHKLLMIFNKWMTFTFSKTLQRKVKIIQNYLRNKMINIKFRSPKRGKNNDVMLLELKPRLSIIDSLKNIFVAIPVIVKRKYYFKWKKEYYLNNENKKLLSNQAYLRNLNYLKVIVKLKRFVINISTKKTEHIYAYLHRWIRTALEEKTLQSSLIIQKFIYNKFQHSKQVIKNRILRSIYSIYSKNSKESVLKHYFLKLMKRFLLIDINYNAGILQRFIKAKIYKKVLRRKEINRKIQYIRDLLIKLVWNNENKIYKNHLLKVFFKWIKDYQSHNLSKILLSKIFSSLFKNYINYSVKKSLVLHTMLNKLNNGIKYTFLGDKYKRIKEFSEENYNEKQERKKIKTNNMLSKLAYYLNKKLSIKTEAVFKMWKNQSYNSSVDRYARVLQGYFKSISNAVMMKKEKEANKKIIRKKGSILSQRVAIIVRNLFFEKEKRAVYAKALTCFNLWKKRLDSGKVLKSGLLRSGDKSKVNSLLSSIFSNYSNNILTIKTIYKTSWFSKITQMNLNIESMKIQNYCKKQLKSRKLTRSQELFNHFSQELLSKEVLKLHLFSKFFRVNFSIEKIGKKALIFCLQTNLSITIIESINDIFKKIIKKMRRKLLKDISSLSKSSRITHTIETLMKRRTYKYLIYCLKSRVLTKNIYLLCKEIFTKKLLSFAKLMMLSSTIKSIYHIRYFEKVSLCVFSHKFKLIGEIEKLYESSFTKQIRNLNIFSKLLIFSQTNNKSFKKKYFYKLFSPVTTFLNRLFHQRFKAFQNICLKQLHSILKNRSNTKLKENKMIKLHSNVFFELLKKQMVFNKFNALINSFSRKIFTKNVINSAYLNKFVKNLAKPFLRMSYSLTVIKQIYLYKFSCLLNRMYKQIRLESSIGLKKAVNNYIKQFLFFRNLIVDKHKEISVSPIFIKIMSFKLRKGLLNNMISFFKYNRLHRVNNKIIKSFIFSKILMSKYIPRIDSFMITLSDKIIRQERSSFSRFFMLHSFQKKITHTLFKNVFRYMISEYKKRKNEISAFTLLIHKVRLIYLKNVIGEYSDFKRKRVKDLRNILTLRRCLCGIMLKKVISNLKMMKKKSQEFVRLKRFIDKVKSSMYLLISKNMKEMNILNYYKRTIVAFEEKIKKTFVKNIIKRSTLYNELEQKWSFIFSRIKFVMKKFLMKKIQKTFKSKENFKNKANYSFNSMIETIKNAVNIKTLNTLIDFKQRHIKNYNNLYSFNTKLKSIFKTSILRYLQKSEEKGEEMRTKIGQFSKKLKTVICNEVFHSLYQTKNRKGLIETTFFYIINKINQRLYLNPYKNRLLYSFNLWRGYKFVLSRMIKRKAKDDEVIYVKAYNMWRKKSISISSNQCARKIQTYLMKRLLRIKNKVFEKKQFQIELRNRGFLKLSSIVRKLPFREAWRKILCERKRRILISFLLLLKSKKRSYLKRFMLHFKKTFKIKNEKYNKAVERVITKFRNRKFRKDIMKLLVKIRVIRELINSKKNKAENQLCKVMNCWRKKTHLIRYIHSVKYVQYYLRCKLYNLSIIQQNKIISLRTLLKDYVALKHIKPFFKSLLSHLVIKRGLRYLDKYFFKKFMKNIDLIEDNNEMENSIMKH